MLLPNTVPFTLFFTVTDREIRPGVHAQYSGAERALPSPPTDNREIVRAIQREPESERADAMVCMKEGGERGERASRISN